MHFDLLSWNWNSGSGEDFIIFAIISRSGENVIIFAIISPWKKSKAFILTYLNSINSRAPSAHNYNNKKEADNTNKQIFNGQTSVQVS